MGKIKLTGLILLLTTMGLYAQTNRYIVVLSDKAQSAYSISNPIAFLSQRAIDRRIKQGITITEQDLPVNAGYVDEITNLGVDVYFRSKWFNALLVQTDASNIPAIEDLAFVEQVQLVAPGGGLSKTKIPIEIPETFLTPKAIDATTTAQLSLLNADIMHDDGFKGEGMIIAMLDAGFPGVNQYKMFQHIFTENRLLGCRNFVTNSDNPFIYTSASNTHGSNVFSTIAMDYGEEVQGMAPKASFVLCTTEDVSSEYRIEEYNWIFGAEYADSIGADIINTSLGYSIGFTSPYTYMDYSVEDLDGETAIISKGAAIAASKGMVVVVSAGNEGNDPWKYVTPPADAEGVLVVGSVNAMGQRSSFSSIGPTTDGRIKPDVMAMGSSTTIFKGSGVPDRVDIGSGTSFAAPLIAGFAAAIWQANPTWKSSEVINAIKYSGSNSLSPDTLMGYGIPDYELAVTNSTLSILDIVENRIHVYPNPFSDGKLNINIHGLSREPFIDLKITDLKGSILLNQRIYPKMATEDVFSFDFPGVESGIYLLGVTSAKYNKSIKLIKF